MACAGANINKINRRNSLHHTLETLNSLVWPSYVDFTDMTNLRQRSRHLVEQWLASRSNANLVILGGKMPTKFESDAGRCANKNCGWLQCARGGLTRHKI